MCKVAVCKVAVCKVAVCKVAVCKVAVCKVAVCKVAVCKVAVCKINAAHERRGNLVVSAAEAFVVQAKVAAERIHKVISMELRRGRTKSVCSRANTGPV